MAENLKPVTLAQNRLRANAVSACNTAELYVPSRRVFSINDLDEPRRVAAHALIYAALAHVLGSPGKHPKTLSWQGRRWYLVPRDRGCLEVQAYRGVPGLVSMPGALP